MGKIAGLSLLRPITLTFLNSVFPRTPTIPCKWNNERKKILLLNRLAMFWFKNFIICYGRLEGVSNSLRTVRCEYFFPPRSSSTLAEFLPSHLGGCQAATEGKFLALTLQQSERPAASDSKSSGCNFGPGNLGSGWSTRPKFTLFCCECKLCLWRKAKMGDGGSYCIPAIVPEKRGCYHWCLNC